MVVARHRDTGYERWMQQEGLPVVQAYGLSDIRTVQLGPWERLGGRGAFIQLVGMEGLTGMYLAEIPPGATLNPKKHLYEELVYILDGRGATEVWSGPRNRPRGEGNSFEWQAGSLFAPPLNTWHRLHNGSGTEPVCFVGVTTAPLVMDLFQNSEFVFGSDFHFAERYDARGDYFNEGDERWRDGPSTVWETNFIPDVRTAQIDLQGAEALGKHSTSYEIGGNVLGGHIEDWPPGLHDMAHYHGGGAIILILRGSGYSLMWPQEAGIRPYQCGNADQVIKIDWQNGSVFSPPTGWFHQHFNTAPDATTRFLAFHYDQHKYGIAVWDVHSRNGVLVSTREGGTQISYKDQDPEITQHYQQELAKAGIQYRSPDLVS